MVEEFDPVQISTRAAPEVKRVPLFIIDDVVYSVPEEVPPTITIRALRELANGAEMPTVIAKAMRDVMGAEAMDALADADGVGQEQMDAIMGLLQRMVVSAVESQTGNSRPAPRR